MIVVVLAEPARTVAKLGGIPNFRQMIYCSLLHLLANDVVNGIDRRYGPLEGFILLFHIYRRIIVRMSVGCGLRFSTLLCWQAG